MPRPLHRSLPLLAACILCLSYPASPVRAQAARPGGPGASVAGVGTESTEFVELATGSRLAGRVELHDPAFRGAYLTIDDSARVDLDDVRAYRSGEGYFRRISGNGSKFARRVRVGRLDLYQRAQFVVSPMMMMPGAPGAPPMMTGGVGSNATFDFFAKGDGDVHPLKYGPLRDAVSDDPQSLRYLNQYRTLGFVQGGLVAAGLGLVAIGLSQLEKQEPPPPLLFVGAGVASTAWIPHVMRGGKLRDAVDSYNRYRFEQ